VEEKRKFPRLDIAVDVQCGRVQEDAQVQKKDPGVTKNISAGGLCLIIYDEVRVGEHLKLYVSLPTGRVICAVGQVVWASPFDVSSDRGRSRCDAGIEFVEISKEDREEIQGFVWNNPDFRRA